MRHIITLSLVITASHLSAKESHILNLSVLTHPIANKAVAAAVDECTRRGFKVAAAITGRDGNLLAFTRHTLAGPHTIAVSQQKAFTAATLQAPTDAQIQKDRPDLNFAPGILLIQGAQPINIGGRFYGGIAVAGADTQTDEECAKHGLTVISDAVEFAD